MLASVPRTLLLILVGLAVTAGVVLLHPPSASACSCAGLSTARALRQADAVFRGTVTSSKEVTRTTSPSLDIRFRVDAVYKGTAYADQVVSSANNSASCGLTPDVGSTWLIFAVEGVDGTGDRAVSRLVTGLCSGNMPNGTAPPVLGAPRPPLPGASDRSEQALDADRSLSRGFAIAGIGVLFLGAVAVLLVVAAWRPRRS